MLFSVRHHGFRHTQIKAVVQRQVIIPPIGYIGRWAQVDLPKTKTERLHLLAVLPRPWNREMTC